LILFFSMKERHIVHSLGAMRDFAREFVDDLQGGDIIELVGDLGAGKTTFVKAVADYLNVKVRVKSPTFSIVHDYPVSGHESIKHILHLDLYRLEGSVGISELGLEDQIGENTVVFIEWPNAVVDLGFSATKRLILSHIDEKSREIIYEKFR